MSLVGEPASRFTCSRAGCENEASWRIRWRNPRIHGTDRVKVWLACDDHRDYLREFLAARDFPIAVDDRLGDEAVPPVSEARGER